MQAWTAFFTCRWTSTVHETHPHRTKLVSEQHSEEIDPLRTGRTAQAMQLNEGFCMKPESTTRQDTNRDTCLLEKGSELL